MGKKLYVGNLAYETTESTLTELFEGTGEVVSTSIITDRMSGRSKGFGFVEMADEAAAQQAIGQFDGQVLDGRPIKVAEARPRQPRREDRWGGGRY